MESPCACWTIQGIQESSPGQLCAFCQTLQKVWAGNSTPGAAAAIWHFIPNLVSNGNPGSVDNT